MLKDHLLYTKKDFTQEEIDRENFVAELVIKEGYLICKRCGKMQDMLEGKCMSALREHRENKKRN